MDKGFKKKRIVSVLIVLTLLIAYNIVFFVVPFNRTLSGNSFWITYGVSHFIAVVNVFLVRLGLGDKKIESRILGIPIIQVGLFVGLIQFVLDLSVMIVGNYISIPYWITILLEVVLLVIFSISIIVRQKYRSTIIRISIGKKNEDFIKNLRIEMEQIFRSLQADAETKRAMFRLLESVKYTIALSDERVFDLEEDISQKTVNLKEYIETKDFVKAKETIIQINSLIKERKTRLSM